LRTRLPQKEKRMAEPKRGTKSNPIKLRSVDGGEKIGDEEYVLVPMKVIRLLQGREAIDTRPSNTHELHADDPEIPATEFNWKELDRRVFGTDTDHREVERLMNGKDTVDNKSFQRVKEYLGSQIVLSDREKLVCLATMCLTKPMPVRAIGRAMKIKPNHVRRLRWHAMKVMKAAPPAHCIEARIGKAQAARKQLQDEEA